MRKHDFLHILFEESLGIHAGTLFSGMIDPSHWNSVGAPHPTPAIWPIQPAFILSSYCATGSRRNSPSSDAVAELPRLSRI